MYRKVGDWKWKDYKTVVFSELQLIFDAFPILCEAFVLHFYRIKMRFLYCKGRCCCFLGGDQVQATCCRLSPQIESVAWAWLGRLLPIAHCRKRTT